MSAPKRFERALAHWAWFSEQTDEVRAWIERCDAQQADSLKQKRPKFITCQWCNEPKYYHNTFHQMVDLDHLPYFARLRAEAKADRRRNKNRPIECVRWRVCEACYAALRERADFAARRKEVLRLSRIYFESRPLSAKAQAKEAWGGAAAAKERFGSLANFYREVLTEA